ncbi:hypothetical protein [Enterococcus faecalis]|uniref:hypothetical protein n=1 Tax=Enterococcus faecalis TaxID=1351 RepID=UPI001A04239A|nr:hypothetical protein [Enterococcus faecalis]EGO2604394.1 hypothetical protein [Enterococcus faecalis]EGO6564383.1 hypothetical protein [Enterococcus faecalis]EGO8879616.1 hypothetical protein [Enterococcus faecalis]EGO8952420.1 hypothetical protein [Enterococcus faecalis]EGO8973898.1 hypothetical protein [Enterococcus faecalis]
MHELIKEIERQLEMDRIEEGNMSAEDVLYIVKGFKRTYLNENQHVVLNWLKSDDHPNYSNIFDLFSDLLEYQVPTKVGEAFTEMMTDQKQQIQVLQAFSCWAIEQEEE